MLTFLAFVVIFLLGIALGLHLARRAGHIGQESQQRATTSTVLAALKVAAPVIDDARMLCPTCWEARHPGRRWFLRTQSFCQEHVRLMATGEQKGGVHCYSTR